MHNNNNSHFLMEKFLHDKMNKIYIYHAISVFARSLIGIFVPIYLYKLGYLIKEILFYSIGQSIIFLLVIPITIKIVKKIGFKYTLLLTIPVYIVHIISLNFLTQFSFFFHLSWFTFGIFTGIFWPSYHSEIAMRGSNKSRGSQMGTIQIITTLFGTLAPIIGGYFLEFLSYYYLVIFVTCLLIISITPLLMTKDIKLKHYSFNYKKYFLFLKNAKYKKSRKTFIYTGIHSTLVIFLWPIMLFIILNENFFSYGSLITIISLISVLLIAYIKAFFNTKKKNEYLKKINICLSINWFFKSIAFLFSVVFIYIIESIYTLLNNMFNMTYMAIFYNNAKKNNYLDYIICRELYLHLTRIIFSLILIFIFAIFQETIMLLSIFIFLGVFVSLGFNSFKEELDV